MKIFASIRLTVVCLLWLAVLTVWGTIYQRPPNGLYMAQEKFFSSWFVYYVLPGGMTTMTVLFLNLLTSLFAHYKMGWKMPGLMLIHLGLILMLLGGLFTKFTGMEAQLSLVEGEGSNVAVSRDSWEISCWEYPDAVREVTGVVLSDLRKGGSFDLPMFGISAVVNEIHRNADPRVQDNPPAEFKAPFGVLDIHTFNPLPLESDPGHNVPGVILTVTGTTNATEVLLWGNDPRPLHLQREGGKPLFVQLRRKRVEMPVFVELVDFRREYYPGSDIPKDYRSLIVVRQGDETERDVIVKMNTPFRFRGWTWFQQSFAIDGESELSVFAVTRNYGRLIPYWATGIVSVGLFVHFGQMQWLTVRRLKKMRKKGGGK